jgi:RsiW-degrading membrane proteinase PrsW (M82 family)
MKALEIIPLFISPVFFVLLSLMAMKMIDKKEFRLFTGSYFFGLITVVPMILVLFLVSNYWLTSFTSLRRIIFFSFVIVGFMAEFVKFLILRYYYIPKEMITKPFDGILFSLMIAMGYATTVNIYFFLFWDLTPDTLAVNYIIPFANLLIAVLMGFFIGMGKFRTNNLDSFIGLSAATFFHGFFIFNLISRDYLLLGLVSFGTLIIVVMLAVKSLNTNIKTIV